MNGLLPGARPSVLVDSARLVLLALAALGIGWTGNRIRREPLPLAYRTPAQRLETATPGQHPGSASPVAVPQPIDLEQFRSFATARRGVVIDARTPAFFEAGHVPGAINLPRESFAAGFNAREPLLPAHRTEEIAVYCSDADCPDAELVAGALARVGFTHVRIYHGGWEEWTSAGLPQEISAGK